MLYLSTFEIFTFSSEMGKKVTKISNHVISIPLQLKIETSYIKTEYNTENSIFFQRNICKTFRKFNELYDNICKAMVTGR